MDSRHESFKEGLLNQLIKTINSYIINNTDDLLMNDLLQKQIIEICNHTYHYLGVSIDTDGIISKHNLLSIDVVLFPEIHDPEAKKILTDEEFDKLIKRINSAIRKHQYNAPGDEIFRASIVSLFENNSTGR